MFLYYFYIIFILLYPCKNSIITEITEISIYAL